MPLTVKQFLDADQPNPEEDVFQIDGMETHLVILSS